jgi:hypothetical protein
MNARTRRLSGLAPSRGLPTIVSLLVFIPACGGDPAKPKPLAYSATFASRSDACCPDGWLTYQCPGENLRCHNPALACPSTCSGDDGCDFDVTGTCAPSAPSDPSGVADRPPPAEACCPEGWLTYQCPGGSLRCHNPALACPSTCSGDDGCDFDVTGTCGGGGPPPTDCVSDDDCRPAETGLTCCHRGPSSSGTCAVNGRACL